jgi:hypothetical protein
MVKTHTHACECMHLHTCTHTRAPPHAPNPPPSPPLALYQASTLNQIPRGALIWEENSFCRAAVPLLLANTVERVRSLNIAPPPLLFPTGDSASPRAVRERPQRTDTELGGLLGTTSRGSGCVWNCTHIPSGKSLKIDFWHLFMSWGHQTSTRNLMIRNECLNVMF